MTSSTVRVTRGSKVVGLRLRPEAAQLATQRAPKTGGFEPLSVDGEFAFVWTDLVALLDERPSWSGIIREFSKLGLGDSTVASAVNALIETGGNTTIAELAAAAGLSERQLRRRFWAATGMPPKQFASVQRLRHALILSLRKLNWAGLAHDSGFADQPHLMREIKGRFGSPAHHVVGYLSGIRHNLLSHGGVRIVQDGQVGDT